MSVAVTRRAVFVMLSFKNVFIQNSIVQFQKLLLKTNKDLFWQDKTLYLSHIKMICSVLSKKLLRYCYKCSVAKLNRQKWTWTKRRKALPLISLTGGRLRNISTTWRWMCFLGGGLNIQVVLSLTCYPHNDTERHPNNSAVQAVGRTYPPV